ncbi:MAG TPA: substrate-binding domain-containing protein [Casimicrobiaceae bacterium]|nr:substrate-binding domain-containing protein [Casimicrobiaceae bacterium]
MATAATVRAGMAQAAFGIEAAARAHGLKFVQLVRENYYLACRRKSPARVVLDAITATAKSPASSASQAGSADTSCVQPAGRCDWVSSSAAFHRRARRFRWPAFSARAPLASAERRVGRLRSDTDMQSGA